MKKDKSPKSNERVEAQPKAKAKAAPAVVFEPKLIYAVIAALVAFVLYANTIGHQYVLDDNGIIVDNVYVQQGLKGLKGIFSSDVWHFQNVNLGYYRPLSLATFAIENQFFPQNPHIGHWDNVLLYAITGFFVCLLLMRIFKNYNPLFALFISILFIAHPIHTEVVANIKSRDEILSFLNLVIALYVMLKAVNSAAVNYKLLALSCFFFYLALLSKETAAVGFLLVPVILFFEKRFTIKELALYTLPFVGIFLIFQFQKYEIFGVFSASEFKDMLNYPYVDSDVKLPSMFLLFAWCVKLLVIPYPLSYSYAYNEIPAASWGSIGSIAGLLLAVLIVVFIFREAKTKTPAALGTLLVIITLAPAMLFVLLRGGILAERFLYAPALGFSILLAWLVFKLSKSVLDGEINLKQASLIIPLALIFCCYSFVTISRSMDWKDQLTLNAHDVNVTPNSAQVHEHYGIILIENGTTEKDDAKKKEDFDKGMSELRAANQIYPHLSEVYNEMGIAYHRVKGNYDSALYYYNLAILEHPNYAPAYLSLGTVYENTNQQDLASYYYNRGVELNPYFPAGVMARDNHRKRTGLDVKVFPAVNNVDPAEAVATNKDFNFYSEMGQKYGKNGDFINATRCLEKAVELNPSSTDALINLSLCFAMQKKYDQSIDELNKALTIEPTNKLALNNLAIIYEHIGQTAKAAECRKKISELP